MSDMDRELDRLSRELRDEALPESALEAVRSGVRTQIATGKRRRMAWMGLGLAAAAAALWFAAIVVREPPLARLPVVAARTPVVPEAEFQRAVAAARSHLSGGVSGRQREDARTLRAEAGSYRAARSSTGVAAIRSVRKASPATEPKTGDTQFIQMVTDDPNVVILWALNSKGEIR